MSYRFYNKHYIGALRNGGRLDLIHSILLLTCQGGGHTSVRPNPQLFQMLCIVQSPNSNQKRRILEEVAARSIEREWEQHRSTAAHQHTVHSNWFIPDSASYFEEQWGDKYTDQRSHSIGLGAYWWRTILSKHDHAHLKSHFKFPTYDTTHQ